MIPITLGVLAGLFFIQSHGTGKVGAFFGPVTVLWFLAIGAMGAMQLAKNPSVLHALEPAYAVDFMFAYPLLGFLVLGAVFLAVTGGEALYADMGHFGKRPIRIAWLARVPRAPAQLFRPGRVRARQSRGDQEPVLPDGAGMGTLSDGGARHLRRR